MKTKMRFLVIASFLLLPATPSLAADWFKWFKQGAKVGQQKSQPAEEKTEQKEIEQPSQDTYSDSYMIWMKEALKPRIKGDATDQSSGKSGTGGTASPAPCSQPSDCYQDGHFAGTNCWQGSCRTCTPTSPPDPLIRGGYAHCEEGYCTSLFGGAIDCHDSRVVRPIVPPPPTSTGNRNDLTGQGYDPDAADRIFSNGRHWRQTYRENGWCAGRFWSKGVVSADDRLADCRLLRTNLIWRRHDGTSVLYDSWTPQQKARFNEYFQALWRNTLPNGEGCDNALVFMRGDSTMFYFNEQQAFDFYARQAAWALIMEIRELVPWSIIILPANELSHLLSSDHYLNIVADDRAYTPHNGLDYSDSLVCDPRISYLFFSGRVSTTHENMIMGTEGETMRAITKWFTNNVRHKTNSIVNQDVISDRAYLEDRLRAGEDDGSPPNPLHAVYVNYGCHSGARLFQDVARGLNIPVIAARFGGHSGLAWRWGRSHAKVCWHADDLYLNYAADASNYMYESAIRDYVSDPSRKDRIVFDAIWLGLDRMRAWGWSLGPIFDPLPLLTVFSEGEPQGGTLLSSSTDAQPTFRFNLEKDMATCNWEMMWHYCRVGDFETWLSTGFSTDRTPSTRPVTRTAEEVRRRAADCERLHDGCANWEAVSGAWLRNIGANPFPRY